ncbi:hypothetical protein P8452_65588 [Trifolium repens]|nr:hypothetical protein P8452_65588 [Trifolium repens]
MTTKFHPVKDINKKKEIWRLAVILDDIWSVYKGDTEDHVEVLLRDVNGETIQDIIHGDDLLKWKELMKEGSTYFMRNFRVSDNDFQYKMSEHKCKLTFVGATKVDELDVPEIPPNVFKFKDFAEIKKGNYRQELLVDVIGVVDDIGKCVAANAARKGNVAFVIKDLSDNTLDVVTLWDALSVKFIDFFNNRSDLGPVVLIIKHARVKETQGNYPLQFTNVWNGTKLLFDENIPEIKAFKTSLPKDVNYASQSMSICATIYINASTGKFK